MIWRGKKRIYIEAKCFEIFFKKLGNSTQFCIKEERKYDISNIWLDKGVVEWLVSVLQKYGNQHYKEIFYKCRIKGKLCVVEVKKNTKGSFMQLLEFKKGRRSTFIIIQEGMQAKVWRLLSLNLNRVLNIVHRDRILMNERRRMSRVMEGKSYAEAVKQGLNEERVQTIQCTEENKEIVKEGNKKAIKVMKNPKFRHHLKIFLKEDGSRQAGSGRKETRPRKSINHLGHLRFILEMG